MFGPSASHTIGSTKNVALVLFADGFRLFFHEIHYEQNMQHLLLCQMYSMHLAHPRPNIQKYMTWHTASMSTKRRTMV